MGNIIQYRLHQAESQVGLMRLVIYCDEKYCEDLHQVALNEELAALLIKINPERRTLKIERCFQKVLADVPENSCIRNFDVLFNPAYKIDATSYSCEPKQGIFCFVARNCDRRKIGLCRRWI